eukprot:TRINITY_DN950_c0_g1_i10.p1 TRINITY_DN950_c0_g1~~TRINITY_DN950_c0_g1_i10.p1  ORF type:complete len:280 (-),score=55.72 TRINITY_DN950_c0_g1_i10:1407-2246(-)
MVFAAENDGLVCVFTQRQQLQVTVKCGLCLVADKIEVNFRLRNIIEAWTAVECEPATGQDTKDVAFSCVYPGCQGRAVVECDVCQALCKEHADVLHRMNSFLLHNVYPVGKKPRFSKACKDHPGQERAMYCKTDDSLVCAVCFLAGDHKGHDVVEFSKAMQALPRAERKGLASRLASQQEQLHAAQKELTGLRVKAAEQEQQQCRMVDAATEKAKEMVDEYAAHLKEELTKECTARCDSQLWVISEQLLCSAQGRGIGSRGNRPRPGRSSSPTWWTPRY